MLVSAGSEPRALLVPPEDRIRGRWRVRPGGARRGGCEQRRREHDCTGVDEHRSPREARARPRRSEARRYRQIHGGSIRGRAGRGAEELRRALEVDDAQARARSERARARVATLKRGFARTKGSQNRRGQVMSAVDASWIAARNEKQRRSAIDQDLPDVLERSSAKLLRDRQSQGPQPGDLPAKLGGVVLPSASLRKSQRRRVVFSVGHHGIYKHNHCLGAALERIAPMAAKVSIGGLRAYASPAREGRAGAPGRNGTPAGLVEANRAACVEQEHGVRGTCTKSRMRTSTGCRAGAREQGPGGFRSGCASDSGWEEADCGGGAARRRCGRSHPQVERSHSRWGRSHSRWGRSHSQLGPSFCENSWLSCRLGWKRIGRLASTRSTRADTPPIVSSPSCPCSTGRARPHPRLRARTSNGVLAEPWCRRIRRGTIRCSQRSLSARAGTTTITST